MAEDSLWELLQDLVTNTKITVNTSLLHPEVKNTLNSALGNQAFA